MSGDQEVTYCYRPGSLLWIINNINFQYFSVLITIVSALVMVVVSYMTSARSTKRLPADLRHGLGADRQRTRASWDCAHVAASAVVLACILGAYLYFRG